MSKPSEELLRRAREQAEAYVTGVRKDGWLTNENTVRHLAAFGEQFAEQIVRECSQIAKTEQVEMKPEKCNQCWDGFRLHQCSYHQGYDDAAATVGEIILRKFGLKE